MFQVGGDGFICMNCEAEYSVTRYDNEDATPVFCPYCGYCEEDDDEDEEYDD